MRDDNVAQNQVVEDGNAQISLSALRVFGLQASPRGQRIGPLLTYHHALEVQDRGCPYVVARDVSAAGGPFHMPLGFRDFVGQPTWTNLFDRKGRLDRSAREVVESGARYAALPDDTDLLGSLIAEKDEVTTALSQVAMFIDTPTLISNSQQAFGGHWTIRV